MMDEAIGVARDRVLQRMANENLNLRIELEATMLRLQQAQTVSEELTKSLEAEKAKHAPRVGSDKDLPKVDPTSDTKH